MLAVGAGLGRCAPPIACTRIGWQNADIPDRDGPFEFASLPVSFNTIAVAGAGRSMRLYTARLMPALADRRGG